MKKKLQLALIMLLGILMMPSIVNASDFKEPVLTVDKNSNGIADFQDEICLDDECFIVITNDSTEIKALAKMAITIENNPIQKFDFSTYQSNASYDGDKINFTDDYFWDITQSGVQLADISQSKVYTYLVKYNNILKNNGYSVGVTMPTYADIMVGCTYSRGGPSCPSFYKGMYWINNVERDRIYAYLGGSVLFVANPITDEYSIRPLLVVKKLLSEDVKVTNATITKENDGKYIVKMNDGIKKFTKDLVNLNLIYNDTQVTYDKEIDLVYGTNKSYKVKLVHGDRTQEIELEIETGKYDCNVTLDIDGKSSSEVVVSGNKLVKPTDPKKKGYSFVGWYTDSNFENKYDFDTEIIKDITLYAKFEYDYTYTFLEGNNQKFELTKVNNYKFRVDGDFNLFDSLVITGLDLEKDKDYKVTKGSTIIEFTESGIAKLNTLEASEYDIEVNYKNGKVVKGNLIIDKPKKQIPETSPKTEEVNPQTHDGIMIWVILGLISVIGLIEMIIYRKKIK